MSGIKKVRSLKRYLNRRKISSVEEWASSFSTLEDLHSFCKSNNLQVDTEIKHFNASTDMAAERANNDLPKSKSVASKPPPKKARKEESQPPSSKPRAWHTPAAKRPLKKSPAVTEKPKKK
jgi:hypothetical protein